MPLLYAQLPSVWFNCGTVNDVRTMYGDFVVMIAVAAFIFTMNFFACADTSPAASALGVSAKPASRSTLSRTMSSCASRLGDSRRDPPGFLGGDPVLFAGTLSAVLFDVGFEAFIYLPGRVEKL